MTKGVPKGTKRGTIREWLDLNERVRVLTNSNTELLEYKQDNELRLKLAKEEEEKKYLEVQRNHPSYIYTRQVVDNNLLYVGRAQHYV